MLASKGDVWISGAGRRLEWQTDLRLFDPLTASSILIDGEKVCPGDPLPDDFLVLSHGGAYERHPDVQVIRYE
ncbi:hypothetical protein [Gemmobacter sp. 24YEA27]|uniref:hypothetical protein n=1 Tax=Gemmobacter sp. 24YEA27 TaxID=3040672 RepID=UPI0024B39E3E|nr:hypothetical protein [Gemmobacter sp. 24YEA27]